MLKLAFGNMIVFKLEAVTIPSLISRSLPSSHRDLKYLLRTRLNLRSTAKLLEIELPYVAFSQMQTKQVKEE